MKRFLPTLSSLLLFVACSSGGSGTGTAPAFGDAGPIVDASVGDGGDAEPAKPQAILRTNGGAAAGCETVPALVIGDFGDPTAGTPSEPVPNGTKEDGTVVAVTCKVVPKTAGGFTVYGAVGRSGTTFEISSDVDATGASTAGKMSLVGPNATWTSETCQLTQSSPSMGVAAGRYWANVTCMGATSTANTTCDIFAEVRLENCTQE